MKTTTIIWVLMMLILASCNYGNEEEPEYSVIEPGSYLPAYPDSWWKYLVNDTLIVVDSTSHSYVLHNYVMYYDEKGKPFYSEKVYVPYYYSNDNGPSGIYGPIYYYDKIVSTLWPPGHTAWPILKETIGSRFTDLPVDNHSSVVETFTVKEKYFNGQDSVLVIIGRPNLDVPDIHVREFYKNIGLARDFYIDTVFQDTLSSKILVDYYISH